MKTTDAGSAEEFTKERKKDLVQKARALSREARCGHAYLTIAKTDGWKMANQVMGSSTTADLTDDQTKQLEKLRKQQQEKTTPQYQGLMQPVGMGMMHPMGMAPYPGYGFPRFPGPMGPKRPRFPVDKSRSICGGCQGESVNI